ncbi:hypothetical protein [Pedobacter psychrophilus]|nr:hypothetical protein [Pedobacter psychrophilus]
MGVCPVPTNGKMYVCITTDFLKRPNSEVVGAGSDKKIRKEEDGK